MPIFEMSHIFSHAMEAMLLSQCIIVVFSCSWCKILRIYCQKLSTRYNLQTTMTGWSQKSLKGQTNTYSVFSPFSLEYKTKSLSDTSNIDLIQIL